jgi:uncharacterized protein (DUF2147 family)
MIRTLLSIALLFSATAYAQPNDALGLWQTADPDGRVRVSVCGQSVCGALEPGAPVAGRPSTDVKNPNRALRSRSLAGLVIMDGFTRSASGWVNGRVYDPNSGNTYRSELLPQANGTLLLKGCFGPFCRSEVWRRVP